MWGFGLKGKVFRFHKILLFMTILLNDVSAHRIGIIDFRLIECLCYGCDTDFVINDFMVNGYGLFRFCPSCGCSITDFDFSDSTVALLKEIKQL
ncbi:MAG: hypothetical protein JWQ09_1139 [Segetibacter sp.]|nr:hypothetical protein [Segetibacter sp.]